MTKPAPTADQRTREWLIRQLRGYAIKPERRDHWELVEMCNQLGLPTRLHDGRTMAGREVLIERITREYRRPKWSRVAPKVR